jgi:hypothetical protein
MDVPAEDRICRAVYHHHAWTSYWSMSIWTAARGGKDASSHPPGIYNIVPCRVLPDRDQYVLLLAGQPALTDSQL